MCFLFSSLVSTKLTYSSGEIISMFVFIMYLIFKKEKTPNDNEAETLFCKTPGLKNPDTYVLTQNHLKTYMILVFSDLNKTQISQMLSRDNPYHKKEILMSFKKLNLFLPIEHTGD